MLVAIHCYYQILHVLKLMNLDPASKLRIKLYPGTVYQVLAGNSTCSLITVTVTKKHKLQS